MTLAEFPAEDVIRFTAGIDFEPPITLLEAQLVASLLNGTKDEDREIIDLKFDIVSSPKKEQSGEEVDPRCLQLFGLIEVISRLREEQHHLQPGGPDGTV